MSNALQALMIVEKNLSHICIVASDLPSTASDVADESLLLVPKLKKAITERDEYRKALKSMQGYLSNWVIDVECGLKPTLGSLRAAIEETATALKGGAA